jgi:hypothetical protein
VLWGEMVDVRCHFAHTRRLTDCQLPAQGHRAAPAQPRTLPPAVFLPSCQTDPTATCSFQPPHPNPNRCVLTPPAPPAQPTRCPSCFCTSSALKLLTRASCSISSCGMGWFGNGAKVGGGKRGWWGCLELGAAALTRPAAGLQQQRTR